MPQKRRVRFRPHRHVGRDGRDHIVTNNEKAAEAMRTLMDFRDGEIFVGAKRFLDPDRLGDFLVNLRHLCHRENVDFDELLVNARREFYNER
jgi:hypothetical protein